MGARPALNGEIRDGVAPVYLAQDALRRAERALRAELASLAVARADFPMLTAWGVENFSQTIHSLGCNYLAAVGRAAGFWAISEYPVRVPSVGAAGSVRPDVAWWDRDTGEPVLLGEFERAEARRTGKLVDKAGNLLRAHHALGERPRLLLLMGWALAGTDLGDPGPVRAVMASGCRAPDGTAVRGLGRHSTFLLATAVFGDLGAAAGNGRRLLRVLT
jgi:hypothetical protein